MATLSNAVSEVTLLLQFVPGQPVAARVPGLSQWMSRTPGVYARISREGSTHYYQVLPGVGGGPSRGTLVTLSTEGEAETIVRDAGSAADQVAHDMALAQRERAVSAAQEANPEPVLSARWMSAAECLESKGLAFTVRAERVYDAAGNPLEGFRSIRRDDRDAKYPALAVTTDGYEHVQHVEASGDGALQMLDPAAADGRIEYLRCYESTDSFTVRDPSQREARGYREIVAGRKLGLVFRVNGATDLRIGDAEAEESTVDPDDDEATIVPVGELSTSHDRSARIAATAGVMYRGTLIYREVSRAWSHTRNVQRRLAAATEIVGYVTEQARTFAEMALDASAVAPSDAADAILRVISPEWFTESATESALPDREREKARQDKSEKIRESMARLLGGWARPANGLDVVLRAPGCTSNRRVKEDSLYFGTGRERLSQALVAVAALRARQRAGMTGTVTVTAETMHRNGRG